MKDHGLNYLVFFITAFVLLVYGFCLIGEFIYPPPLSAATSEFYSTKVHGADGGDSLVAETGGQIDCATDTLYLQDKQLVIGRYSADPEAATARVVVSGLDGTDWLLATLNVASTTTYVLAAEADVGYATVTLNQDPNASISITVLGFKD